MIAALLFAAAAACKLEVIPPVTGAQRDAFFRAVEVDEGELRVADADNDGVDDWVVTRHEGSGGYLAIEVFHRTNDGWTRAADPPFGEELLLHDYFDPISGERQVLVRFCGRTYFTLLGGDAPHWSRQAWIWEDGKTRLVCDLAWIAEQRRAFERFIANERYAEGHGFLEDVAQSCKRSDLQRDVDRATARLKASAKIDSAWLLSLDGKQDQYVLDRRFDPLLAAIVPGTGGLLDELKRDLYLPDATRVVDHRYVILTGCRPHDCSNKGFAWIDTKTKASVIAIPGTIASKSFRASAIPSAVWEALNEAIHFDPSERVTFIGPDGRARKISPKAATSE